MVEDFCSLRVEPKCSSVSSVRVSGCNRCFRHQAHLQGGRCGSSDPNVHLRRRFRLVMGDSELAHSERNISNENPSSRTKHQCCSELRHHLCAVSDILDYAVPLQIRCVPVLRRLDRCHDRVRGTFCAGDQRDSFEFNACSLGGALVLA
ncbi:hypothetical protein RJ639_004181 [Escallonia herrerae]|uniref:Uncharacterized protein n=1 Tax=Escallonia herrerae TaxID=1293975 RepID=A0AA89AYX4_9ASTE|nr:hypothetical protein RJ639_004181 [Escallonia herrerae]